MNIDDELIFLLYTTEELRWIQDRAYDICTIAQHLEHEPYDHEQLTLWIAGAISDINTEDLGELQFDTVQIQRIEEEGELWEQYEILYLLQ